MTEKNKDPFGGFSVGKFAPFVSGEEKRKIASKGLPFVLEKLEKRTINDKAQWCADIKLNGTTKCLTFTPSPWRDPHMETIAEYIADNGPIPNTTLTTVGSNTDGKSAAYIFCSVKDWRPPKELPKQRTK